MPIRKGFPCGPLAGRRFTINPRLNWVPSQSSFSQKAKQDGVARRRRLLFPHVSTSFCAYVSWNTSWLWSMFLQCVGCPFIGISVIYKTTILKCYSIGICICHKSLEFRRIRAFRLDALKVVPKCIFPRRSSYLAIWNKTGAFLNYVSFRRLHFVPHCQYHTLHACERLSVFARSSQEEVETPFPGIQHY